MNFWQEPEWIKLKQACVMKTERILTRLEYLKEIGSKEYTEEKYQEYLKIMKNDGQDDDLPF